jgi:hypothetical protein
MTGSLKQQNAWLLRTALIVHAAAFLYVAFEPLVTARINEGGSLEQLEHMLVPGSISLGIIAIARLVLLGLVPSQLRDRLVHWRWHDPLPGSRAFSRIGPADARVDMAALAARYGPLPSGSREQGSLFYSIYKAHADSVGVLDAHKSYLAARDIATINLLVFFLLPPLAYWATHDFIRTAVYAALLLAAYLAFCIAAQVYGTRLVENVLATAAPG